MTNKVEMLVAFSNELTVGEDGWAQIAPFGDFPGVAIISDGRGGYSQEKAIQRMDRKAVTQMVNEFTASQRGTRKFLTSRPIFLGHPDAPGGAAKYPDKQPKGVFASLAMREPTTGDLPGGFYGQPILTDDGAALVASKKVRAFSGRWEADEYLGEEVINGTKTKVFRPTRFLSAGMTASPNLPVEMFNEKTTSEAVTPAQQQPQATQSNPRHYMIATLAFSQFVNETAAKRGLDGAAAMEEASRINPALSILAQALGATPQRLQFFNARHQRQVAAPVRNEKRREFIGKVHDYMAVFKVGYDAAWSICQRRHVEIFNEMTSGGLPTIANGGSAPVAGPQVNATMKLPAGTEQRVLNVAFAANGGRLTPLDPARVFDGLVQFFMRDRDLSHDASMAYCKENFSALWGAVTDLAKAA